jgi:chromosome segregation ATPase
VNNGAQQHIYSAINLADSRQKKADNEMHDALSIIDDLEKTISTIEGSLEISEDAAEELHLKNAELEAVLEKLTFKVQEQYNLLEDASSKYEEVSKSTALKEDHIETLVQSNADLKADKVSLQKEVEHLKRELLNKTQEHDQQINSTLKKLEDKFNDVE